MARKELYATREMRYGTRMLKAGDPIEVDGPQARLMEALGWAGPNARLKGEAKPQPEQKADPLDHDADGKKGGSTKGETSTRRKGKSKKARK